MPKLLEFERGATLLEVCVCLCLIIILNNFAIPQLQNLKLYFDSRATQKSLLNLLSTTRSRALYRQQVVTLCPLTGTGPCTSEWNQQLRIFVDSNSNAILDADEETLVIWDQLQKYAQLSWTLDRRYIRFRPNGATSATTGSLRYCLADKNSRNNFRLVVARTGRVRVDRETHGCQ